MDKSNKYDKETGRKLSMGERYADAISEPETDSRASVQMNTLDTYADCGRKAGKAATHRDFALVRFHNDWFHRAIRLESKEYAAEATRVFNEAYRQERI